MKILIPGQETPFWYLVKFIENGCKSDLCQVLMVCTSEFIENSSIFLNKKHNNGNMYCEYNGKMFKFLNNTRHVMISTHTWWSAIFSTAQSWQISALKFGCTWGSNSEHTLAIVCQSQAPHRTIKLFFNWNPSYFNW